MKRVFCYAGFAVGLILCHCAVSRAQSAAPLSAQGTADRVKKLLLGFGVKGPLRLQTLGGVTRPPNSKPVLYNVVVIDSKSQRYEAYVRPDGGSIHLYRGSERDSFGGMSSHMLADAKVERRVKGWLASLRTKEPTRLAALTVDEKGIGRASFPILRNGCPFVSHSHYGYDFAFNAASGEFLSFRASENPPPVVPDPPRLNKADALAALKHVWDTVITPHAINVNHFRRVWYTLDGEPELGYYVPSGQTTAILVWKIRYMSMRDVGYAIQGGSDGMLIDAITGAQVPTSVVP